MKQFNLKTTILEKVSNIVPFITVLLVPIFFLPITTEFFSFNKLALITVAMLLLLISLGIKVVTGERIEFIKSSIDKPLVAVLAVMALSTIFSINKTDSIFGTQGRWLGLFSLAVIVGYFFLSTPAYKNSKLIKASLYALIVSSAVSSITSILSYYKIYLSAEPFLRIQNFSLTGSIKDAIILAAISITAALMLSIYENFTPAKIALFASIFINFFFVAITGTFLGWALIIVGIATVLFFVDKELLRTKKLDLIIPLVLMVITLGIILFPKTRGILVDKTYVSEVSLPTKESWYIATSTIQDYPILATGPSTFQLNYTRYKPLSTNNTNLWDRRFDKPYNELFNILGTIGIVGTAVAFIFAIKVLKLSYASKQIKEETGLANVAGVLTIVMMTSFLFTYASILNVFLVFFFLSILVGAHTLGGDQTKHVKPLVIESTVLSSIATDSGSVIASQYTKYVLCIPVFLLAGYIGFLSFKNYAGEYFMRKSLVALTQNDSNGTYNYQILALKYNTNRDTYYDSFARTNLTLANALASKQNLTDTEKQTIQTLVTQSIRNARLASEVVGPLNVSNWETRALIYRNLINTAQNASDWAINSYNTAIQLDPTNPRLRLDLGGVYFAKGDFLSAANQFRQATSLKQDYANAHYNFALSLVRLKEYDQAKKEFEITKLLVPQDSEDRKLIDKEIASLPQPTVAGAATAAKPTVEELTGVEQGVKQEPLTNTAVQETPQNLNTQALPQQNPVTPVTEAPKN
jgi:tetratricopeptide (TPR) repeat protein